MTRGIPIAFVGLSVIALTLVCAAGATRAQDRAQRRADYSRYVGHWDRYLGDLQSRVRSHLDRPAAPIGLGDAGRDVEVEISLTADQLLAYFASFAAGEAEFEITLTSEQRSILGAHNRDIRRASRVVLAAGHARTLGLSLLDAPKSKLRRGQAAALSLEPTSTDSTKAVGLVLPELEDKLSKWARVALYLDPVLARYVNDLDDVQTINDVFADIELPVDVKLVVYLEPVLTAGGDVSPEPGSARLTLDGSLRSRVPAALAVDVRETTTRRPAPIGR